MPSVERVHWAKFRVAAVCLAAVTILSTLVYLLTGGTLLERRTTLYLYLPDATGLSKKSPVRVDGIGVGKVESVVLSGSNEPNRVVKVTMTIELDRLPSITEDSTAQTAADTLVGDQFVDITSGTSANHVQPRGEIHFKGSPEMLKSLDIAQFQARVRAIDALVTQIEQGRGRVGEFVAGEQLYDDISKRLADLRNGIRAAASTTSSVGRELYTDRLYRKISEPLVELDQSLARLQSGQGAAGQLLHDTAQYEQLRSQLGELRRSITDLHAEEFMQSDRPYLDWNRRVASLIQTVDDLNAGPLFGPSEMYDNLNGAAKEMRDFVKDFRENPRKFMRLKVF